MTLNGKVIIITGAKSGIGLATAIRFADEGAKVVVADVKGARHSPSSSFQRFRQAAGRTQVETLPSTVTKTILPGIIKVHISFLGLQGLWALHI